MLFSVALIAVLVALLGQTLWVIRAGALPPLSGLTNVTRADHPVAFWSYVVGSCFVILLLVALATTLLVARF